jgi:hypothetical protein
MMLPIFGAMLVICFLWFLFGNTGASRDGVSRIAADFCEAIDSPSPRNSILALWDAEEKATVDEGQIQAVLDEMAARCGPRASCSETKILWIDDDFGLRRTLEGAVGFTLRGSKGEARYRLAVQKRDGAWGVIGFGLESEVGRP